MAEYLELMLMEPAGETKYLNYKYFVLIVCVINSLVNVLSEKVLVAYLTDRWFKRTELSNQAAFAARMDLLCGSAANASLAPKH